VINCAQTRLIAYSSLEILVPPAECQLPRTYQVWFQITNLHLYLLMTRFRALPTHKIAQTYAQELTNHYFIDAESRMRVRFGIQVARLVKGYMKDMHTQQRGAILSMDEALAISAGGTSGMERVADADAILAAALWRNIWGAGGWGEGVGGVKRKLAGVDRPDEKKGKKVAAETEDEESGAAELAQDLGIDTTGMSPYAIAAAQQHAEAHRGASGANAVKMGLENFHLPAHDLEFAVSMEKLVNFVRRESVRLASLSDEDIESGFVRDTAPAGITDELEQQKRSESIANFGKI
jgi:cytochrome b pre-mRNA-processing protein 3